MLSIALCPPISPLPRGQSSLLQKLAFRTLRNVHSVYLSDSILAFCATPGSFSLAFAVHFHTRQGLASLVAWAYSFPKRLDAARVPEGERLKVTYVALVPCVSCHTSGIPASASLILPEAAAVSIARAFKFSGLYVTPPMTSRPSIGLITHVIQSVVMLKAFPKCLDAKCLGELGLHT